MKKHRIGTIISYCSNDYRFLEPCIKEVQKFSSHVILTACNHFFNGTLENRELLNRSYFEHPSCKFIEFDYNPSKPYGLYCPFQPSDEDWIHYWHSTGRYIGFYFLPDDIDYILFLDIDEIVDGQRFLDWLDNTNYADYEAVRFYSFFYFRSSKFRAKSYSLNALLVKKSSIDQPDNLLTIYERKGIFDDIAGIKLNHVLGLDNIPLVHHYSWVKPKAELLLKVKSWGHHYEKDWASLLEKEFSCEFSGIDTLYGLSYEEVAALYNPLEIDVEAIKSAQIFGLLPISHFSNVKLVNKDSFFQLSIKKMLSGQK
jgi:hypothetical protein